MFLITEIDWPRDSQDTEEQGMFMTISNNYSVRDIARTERPRCKRVYDISPVMSPILEESIESDLTHIADLAPNVTQSSHVSSLVSRAFVWFMDVFGREVIDVLLFEEECRCCMEDARDEDVTK